MDFILLIMNMFHFYFLRRTIELSNTSLVLLLLFLLYYCHPLGPQQQHFLDFTWDADPSLFQYTVFVSPIFVPIAISEAREMITSSPLACLFVDVSSIKT